MKIIYSNTKKSIYKVTPKQFEILLKENLIEFNKNDWFFDEEDEEIILERI